MFHKIKIMTTKYSLLSEEEPTDEQLHEIMADALKDVIERSQKAEAAFNLFKIKCNEDALRKYQTKLLENNLNE